MFKDTVLENLWLEGLSDTQLDFLEEIRKEYPGYNFCMTPAIYSPGFDDVVRGMIVRLPDGSLKKLKAEWNTEFPQGLDPLDVRAQEQAEKILIERIRTSIGEEMKLLVGE